MFVSWILTSANAGLAVTNFVPVSTSTLEGLPLGTADGSATGELALKVITVGGSSSRASAPNAVAQLSIPTTAGGTNFATSRPTRRQLDIQNLDATNFVWLGGSGTSLSSANGFKLLAGQSYTWRSTAQPIALADTGACVLAWVDYYD